MPQYDLGARIIYEALAAGRLRWIGVADRGAGDFDDIVLGLHDRVVGHQLKTSRDPRPFSIRTVLLGAEQLWRSIVESLRRLRAEHPSNAVEVIYGCDDYPRVDDDINGSGRSASTAAFLRAHETHRLSWTLTDWQTSPFAKFVADLQAASGEDAAEFEKVLRDVRFLAAGQARYLGMVARGPEEERRLRDIAAMLPRLVVDTSDRDRWPIADLLARLGWRDPFALKHGHAFPTDFLYQSNVATQDRLCQVLARITVGYVGVQGPPGSGKSTLLAAGLLPTPRAAVVRYLAFVPDESHGLGRAEAEDFLHDLIAQLKQQGLGSALTPGTQLAELREQLASLLREAGDRFRACQIRTVIVVDGLDHVPREERPAHSFLRVLPLPQAVPEGVIFVLGTQRLDLGDMPPEVTRQASADDRLVTVAPLSREAVIQLATRAGVPQDVDLIAFYDRTAGHPLSVRYVTEALRYLESPEARQEWLQNGPAFGGSIEEFYRRVWDDLQGNVDARRSLQYVSLSEGPIHPRDLDRLVGEDATDTAWQAARHLLVRNHHGAWSIFHNSFRLFLQGQVAFRHGLRDAARMRVLYADLAHMTRDSETHVPQRWMELRYRARAHDHAEVATLARPERFRSQFAEGRDPGDIQGDIGFAIRAAGALRTPGLLVELILARHEIIMRCDAIGDDVFEALLQLGKVQAAHGLLEASGVGLSIDKQYVLVEAYLSLGEIEEARRLFDKIEPVEQLLGAEELDPARDTDLTAWAETALVFREPAHFLEALDRLRPPDPRQRHETFDLDAYKTSLKLIALRGQLGRNPSVPLEPLEKALRLPQDAHAVALVLAARVTAAVGDEERAVLYLEAARDLTAAREAWANRDLAVSSARIGRNDLAEFFFRELVTPSFAGHEHDYTGESFRRVTREVVEHAALAVRLGRKPTAGVWPKSRYLAVFQNHLNVIGTLLGEGAMGLVPSLDPLRCFRAAIHFFQHGRPDEPHDPARWRADGVIDEAIRAIVEASAKLGGETLIRLTEFVDGCLNEKGRLSRGDVRRAYALAVYSHDFEAERALGRVTGNVETFATPAEEVAEAARMAGALASLGFEERASDMLERALASSVGYSRAARKDAQYQAWRALLKRACEEDPAGRTDRLLFFARLLEGMAATEGENAGHRLVDVFLEQAAQEGAAWAWAAADCVENVGLATWPDLAAGLLKGAAKANPDVGVAAGVIFGRVALPLCGDTNQMMYESLMPSIPEEHVGRFVRHAVECIEADSHPKQRILLLEALVGATSGPDFEHVTDALNRWRAELPVPESGSSPEDPFFRAQTLAEMADILGKKGDDIFHWGAGRAFERLAPTSTYAQAKVLFDGEQVLQSDERSTELIGHMAMTAGQRSDAVGYLSQLRGLEGEKGGWSYGGYTNAKLRRYRLDVSLNGEAARRAAFDEFVGDLADRRESVQSMLPELDDILELLSPRPSWAATWEHLQEHLRCFREYRIGRDLEVLPSSSHAAEQTLADILFRAVDTTALELAKMVRVAAGELLAAPCGGGVVGALVLRLWQRGGWHALEAAQIAWECRYSNDVRSRLLLFLPKMCTATDLAIRRVGVRLARAWGQSPQTQWTELPVTYHLEIPPNPEVQRFEPPSGHSSTSSGLVTEDPYSWTWPLEEPLRLAVKASGLALPNLRARAAQLMSRMGGAAAFGPAAIQPQQRRLGRLHLHVMHRKLPVAAAFCAMREVAGELRAADALDERAISVLLQHAGAYSLNVATQPPRPRPFGVSRVIIPELHGQERTAEWLADGNSDAESPAMVGGTVLAATAVHERQHFRRRWRVEQYFGPDVGRIEEDLEDQLLALPRVVIDDAVIPLYDGFAPGAVVTPVQLISDSISKNMVTLCPNVAAALGWRPSRIHAFTYVDRNDRVVAETRAWRDGGTLCSDTDAAVFGRGNLLLLAPDGVEDLRPYLGASLATLSWRAAEGSD